MARKRSDKPNPPATPQPSRLAPDRMHQLERLIELMVSKDVVEVELEEAGTRWRVRRTEPQTVTYAAPAAGSMPQMTMAPTAGHQAPAAAATAAAEPQGEMFKSPMLGTFYRAASPEAEPFAKD